MSAPGQWRLRSLHIPIIESGFTPCVWFVNILCSGWKRFWEESLGNACVVCVACAHTHRSRQHLER